VDTGTYGFKRGAVFLQNVQGVVDARTQALIVHFAGIRQIQLLLDMTYDQGLGDVAESVVFVAGGAQLADRIGPASPAVTPTNNPGLCPSSVLLA
jgi:hypothetical protein